MATDGNSGATRDFARFLTGGSAGQTRLRAAAHLVVCQQGALDDSLYYIEEGWVKVSAASQAGKEAVLAVRGPGTVFGTRSLIKQHRRRTSVTTLSECSLTRVTRVAAIHLLRTEPDFAEMFAIYMTLQGLRDQEALTDQLIYPSERRLARTLLRLARNGTGIQPAEISLHISQDDLASMIGTTRSRVSYFMNKFRRSGFIAYDRQGFVTVHGSLRSVDRER